MLEFITTASANLMLAVSGGTFSFGAQVFVTCFAIVIGIMFMVVPAIAVLLYVSGRGDRGIKPLDLVAMATVMSSFIFGLTFAMTVGINGVQRYESNFARHGFTTQSITSPTGETVVVFHLFKSIRLSTNTEVWSSWEPDRTTLEQPNGYEFIGTDKETG